MYLVVGLGNPGKEYENTRHNIGFKVVDALAMRNGLKQYKEKQRSMQGEIKLDGHKVLLVQPLTYTNNSGEAAAEILRWHKVPPSRLIVAYDDVDLDVGQIKVRDKGGAGGHHGIESIIAYIRTNEFVRVRVGVGRDSLAGDVSDYVLAPIPPGQKGILDYAVISAAEAAETVIAKGLQQAMNLFNR
ncbi:MAG: aminoacyl-tRNA hydrolase [Candidatus Margulisbacteria bacterium]|nr:aminoacyl-tRNA hydrolase [Candidatus Margulisiibacteriota bacterium]